jgi:uncharacterized protein YpmB
MNSKQIIITFIIFITLIGAGWYCYDKFKPKTSNSENEPINTIDESPQTTKKPIYQDDGKTIKAIEERDKNEKLVKTTYYQEDGKTIFYIDEYNTNGQKTQTTYYNTNGTIFSIFKYTSDGLNIKTIWYNSLYRTINSVDDYDKYGQKIKKTFYENDGKTIRAIIEYNPDGTEKK